MAHDHPSLRQQLLFLCVGTVIFVTIFQDVLIQREATLVRGFDASTQTFPWMAHLSRQWQSLSPPLWDFTSFSGTSFAGELQTGVFYPPNILLGLLFGDSLSPYILDWYIALHYIFAFYFMTLFLRVNHLGRVAALFGAFAFAAYLDWAQPNRLVGMIYLPLVLYSYQRSLEERPGPRVLHVLLAASALSLTLLGGHTQPLLHSSMALALLALFLAFKKPGWRRALSHFFLIVIGAILMTAPQWLLTFEYVSRSYRWAPERIPGFSSVPYEIYGFISTLEPQLLHYLLQSWIPPAILFGLVALFVARGTKRHLLMYALLLGTFAFLAALGDAGLISRLTWHLPILNTVRQAERYIFLILFSSALILALDLSLLSDAVSTRVPRLTSRNSQIVLVAVSCCTLALLGIWLGKHSLTFLRTQSNNDPLSPGSRYAEDAVVRFLKHEHDRNPAQRILNFRQSVAPNFGNAFGVLTVRGHRGTIYAPYYDYFAGALDDPYSPRWDALGVRYLISNSPVKGMKLRLRLGKIRVYERKGKIGVFYLLSDDGTRQPLPLKEVNFKVNRADIVIKEPVSGRLVFAQPFYPGWEARLKNRTLSISQEGLFMSVPLKSDDRHISFIYDPPVFKLGLILAALPWLAALLLWRRAIKEDSGAGMKICFSDLFKER